MVREEVVVTTPDGNADCYFAAPAGVRSPGVIIWPDILGLRPAFRLMAERLAQAGYAVIVVNPYYRQTPAPVVAEGATFGDPAVREKLIPMARALTAATQTTDALAIASYLFKREEVDPDKGLGTMGYCMGGPFTFRTAAALPERIAAAASFHGGRLVTEGADSPHLLIPKMRAKFLIAVAENDDEKEPATKGVLKEHFAAAELEAEIEVYEGAMHGWCPPDSPVYHEAQAERAWERLLALFARALS